MINKEGEIIDNGNLDRKWAIVFFVAILFSGVIFGYFLFIDSRYFIDGNDYVSEGSDRLVLQGQKWLSSYVQEDGSFVYLYDPEEEDKVYNKNNMIRQLLAARVVAQFCADGEEVFCEIHRKNMNFFFENLYQEEDVDGKTVGYIVYNEKSKLGVNALVVRLLVQSPLFDDYKDRAEKLVRGILLLQNGNGSFEPWYIEPKYKYNKAYILTFYSGEAILALMEYYEKTGDKEVYKMAEKSQDYYIREYVDLKHVNFYPAYVPWHTFSLAKFYNETKNMKYARAIFILNDELLKIQDTYKHVGRFYDSYHSEYGKPHSASDGVYTESLVVAYEIAKAIDDEDRQKKYYKRIKMAIDNLASLQYCNSQSKIKSVDEKYCGGVRTKEDRTSVRIDNVAHMLDAMIKIRGIYERKE